MSLVEKLFLLLFQKICISKLNTSLLCVYRFIYIFINIFFGYRFIDLEMVEFTLHEVLKVSISQVMIKSTGKGIQIVNETAEEAVSETLYGDCLRLQQVLADFLLISVSNAPAGGQLTISTNMTKDQLGKSVHLVHLEFRYVAK